MGKLLRLIAFDAADLQILSAHLQDAQLSTGELVYTPKQQKFALVAARFNWVECETCKNGGKAERLWTGLHFERVKKVGVKGLDLKAPPTALNLLSIAFTEFDPPSGYVELVFSGGAALRLDVECLEALMQDIGPGWPVEEQPGHEE